MRRLVTSVLLVVALGAGSAFAQGFWAGFSVGYPGLNGHFGVEDLAPGLDLRGNLGFAYVGVGGATGFSVGVDVLYGLPIDAGVPIDFYAGGGIGAAIGSTTAVFLEIVGGGEYRLTDVGLPEGGVFAELGPIIVFTPNFGANFVGRLGFNYHFQ